MSLNQDNRRSLSLPLHLTLWYAGIFTISSIILFVIIYIIISSVLQNRMDKDLAEEIIEQSEIFKKEGKQELLLEIQREVGAGDHNKVFTD